MTKFWSYEWSSSVDRDDHIKDMNNESTMANFYSVKNERLSTDQPIDHLKNHPTWQQQFSLGWPTDKVNDRGLGTIYCRSSGEPGVTNHTATGIVWLADIRVDT